jgi:hypothetical protein
MTQPLMVSSFRFFPPAIIMSMREYQMILQEMGLPASSAVGGSGTSSGANNGDMGTIHVEHVLVLRMDEKWEQLVAHAASVLLKQGQKLVLPFKVMAYATSACLVLYGTAKLIESFRQTTTTTTSTTTSSSSSSSPPIDTERPK